MTRSIARCLYDDRRFLFGHSCDQIWCKYGIYIKSGVIEILSELCTFRYVGSPVLELHTKFGSHSNTSYQ